MRSLPFVAATIGALAVAMSSVGASTQSPSAPAKAVTASPKPPTKAPVDQYFGRFKWSVLQIRYETQFLTREINYHTVAPDDAMHKARIIEDTLFTWAQEYPRDTWLPQTSYGVALLFEAIPGPEAHDRAVHLLQRIAARYGTTRYGKQSKLALSNGVPSAADYALVTPAPSPAVSAEAMASAPANASSGSAAPAASTAPATAGSAPAPSAMPSAVPASTVPASAAPAQTPKASPLPAMTPSVPGPRASG